MLLLSNGLVFDGSGSEPFRASVLIDGASVVAIGPDLKVPDCPAFDCSQLAVCPGFIDLHSHADVQVLEERPEKLAQGITTEVVGNCGFSPFPYDGHLAELKEFAGGILGRNGNWGWPSASAYLDTLVQAGAGKRALSLVGHGSLRVAVCGLRHGALSKSESDHLVGLLEDALRAGCVGLSTGLMYAPGSSAGSPELEPLCRIVARYGKLYATHMRSYSAGLIEAVREQIELADHTGCRLQISHLQAAGREYWPLQQQALDEIEAAHARGIDIEFDIYPYQCGSTVLTQLLPQWTLNGGTEALLKRLSDKNSRKAILAEIAGGPKPWSDVTISAVATPKNASFVGKTISEMAQVRSQDPAECALDLLIEEQAQVNIITFNQSEDNLRQSITHPLCSVITDGFYVTGKPHPRLYGTYPELLGSLVRERRWLSLSEAIHKSTGKPAARLKLKDRGQLSARCAADIVIFDPARVQSRSTYETPEVRPLGIVSTIKDGRVSTPII